VPDSIVLVASLKTIGVTDTPLQGTAIGANATSGSSQSGRELLKYPGNGWFASRYAWESDPELVKIVVGSLAATEATMKKTTTIGKNDLIFIESS
jgi:hypothetical protein